MPASRFEPIPDDLSPAEILKQVQNAARDASNKLTHKKIQTKMGYLRQKKDGSTSLAILVPGDHADPETNERPVSLGNLVGKLNHGTGSLQGFREDRRNLAKSVKPLYYGAFGSYAPSYDSTFANLTKEESDLLHETYGDEPAVQYAESILNFAKDCDYTLTMVDNLLDLMTSGEHRKTKKIIDERQKTREEEDKVKQLLETNNNTTTTVNSTKPPLSSSPLITATPTPTQPNTSQLLPHLHNQHGPPPVNRISTPTPTQPNTSQLLPHLHNQHGPPPGTTPVTTSSIPSVPRIPGPGISGPTPPNIGGPTIGGPIGGPTIAAAPVAAETKVEFEQLKSLADLGIDTSFLNFYENPVPAPPSVTTTSPPVTPSSSTSLNVAAPGVPTTKDCLHQTSQLLTKLNQTQTERLSQPPPPHLSQVIPPSDAEVQLAHKITDNLTDLAKRAGGPSSVVSASGVRKAMGVLPTEIDVKLRRA
ncbi:hypothetical protein M8J76_001624 [Diaphorina citri]|nr:hypothetical protein M8J76_001624 [Diaphorina citri]KAI5708712.1 hypothetical protein M8J76_001624 [Diaphorina citri]KAI5708713.1 hypothetical protein M8J76_001624 [Diaphorina citri]